MNRWYFWLVLSAIFAAGGVINYFDGKSIIGQIIQVALTVFLGFTQLFCERKGGHGMKIFRYIATAVAVLLIAWIILSLIFKFI